jgi:hypothetical protein
MREIVQQHMLRFPENLGSRRQEDGYVRSVLAVPLIALSVTPTLRLEMPFELKVKQGVDPPGTLKVNIPSLPSISAARPSSRDKLLPAKGNAPVASAPREYGYFCAIDEQFPDSVIMSAGGLRRCRVRCFTTGEKRQQAKPARLEGHQKKRTPNRGPGKN